MPELSDLMQAQLDKIAQGVMVVDELKAEMRRAIVAERVDWQAERKAFLSDARSSHIREAYARALDHLGKRLELHNLRAANPTPCLADDFIRYMRAISGKDADSTRRVVSACSSFFSFPERRFDEIRNPFRGSRARPASTWTEAAIPSSAELEVLLGQAEPALAAALAVAIEIGLRVGGYRGLGCGTTGLGTPSPRGTGWRQPSRYPRLLLAHSRGRAWIRAGHSAPEGFPWGPGRANGETKGNPEELLVAWLKTRLCAQLMADGKLSAVFSWHDLLHAFAERNAGRGLVWLRDRLGHSSVSVTERYLRNVLNIDTRKM